MSSTQNVLIGWRLVDTDKWWPAMFGTPPREIPGAKWKAIYR